MPVLQFVRRLVLLIAQLRFYACFALSFCGLLCFPAYADDVEGQLVYSIDSELVPDSLDLFGVTVDVFWCSEGPSGPAAASEVAASFGTYARIDQKSLMVRGEGPYVRSVRLRRISILEVPLEASHRNLVAVDSGDLDMLRLVGDLSSASGRSFDRIETSATSRGYLKFVICDGKGLRGVSPRVYFQVASSNQTFAVRDAAKKMAVQFENIRLASEFEVVGPRAPLDTQVRYFFMEDQILAENIADYLSRALSIEVHARLLSMDSVRARGLLEVWIGRDFVSSKPITYDICVGEFQSRCPPDFEWVPCGTQLSDWLSKVKGCYSSRTLLREVTGGNSCGYEAVRVQCGFQNPAP
jgi:hypothetical protein